MTIAICLLNLSVCKCMGFGWSHNTKQRYFRIAIKFGEACGSVRVVM